MPPEKKSWIAKIACAVWNALFVAMCICSALILVVISAPYIEQFVLVLMKLGDCSFVGDVMICK